MIEQTASFALDSFKFDVHYNSPEGPVTRLLIVFPGADYSYLGPFLYYPTQRVLKWQTAVVMADYDFTTWAETMTVSEGEALAFCVAETMKFAMAKHPEVTEFLFLGKSLGAEALLEAEAWLDQRDQKITSAKFVFLTPVWNNNEIVTDMGGLPYDSLYILGDQDPFYSEKVIEFLKSRGKKNIFVIIPGANHELEIPDDFDASIYAQQKIIDGIVEFQKRPKVLKPGEAKPGDGKPGDRAEKGSKGSPAHASKSTAAAAAEVDDDDEDYDDDEGEYDENDPDYED